jgi:hypothetical protein
MATTSACSYCGGAGGNEENLEHNAQCPRFGYEAGVDGLNALRDGARNPVTVQPRLTEAEQRADALRMIGRA